MGYTNYPIEIKPKNKIISYTYLNTKTKIYGEPTAKMLEKLNIDVYINLSVDDNHIFTFSKENGVFDTDMIVYHTKQSVIKECDTEMVFKPEIICFECYDIINYKNKKIKKSIEKIINNGYKYSGTIYLNQYTYIKKYQINDCKLYKDKYIYKLMF